MAPDRGGGGALALLHGATMSYHVIRLDLAEVRDRAPLNVPGNELSAHVVPSPFTVRIGSRDADPITIDRPGHVLRCPGPMGTVYISNDIGAGVLELVVGDVRLDFNPAPPPQVYGDVYLIAPKHSTSPIKGTLMGSPTDGGANRLSAAASGGTYSQTAHTTINGIPNVFCGVLGFNDTQNAWQTPMVELTSGGGAFPISALQPGYNGPDSGLWEISDNVAMARLSNDTSVRAWWGVGLIDEGISGVKARGIFFRADNEGEWHAEVWTYDPDGAGVQSTRLMRVPLGVMSQNINRIGLRLGFLNGSPVCDWLVNGAVAHRITEFPAPVLIRDSAANEASPTWVARLISNRFSGTARAQLYLMAGAPMMIRTTGPGARE